MARRFLPLKILATICFVPLSLIAAGKAELCSVGVAKIDITPDYPIRLTGYASRKTESAGVAQRIWARALAIGSDREGPAILITVDNCGVPANVREELVKRLKKTKHIAPDHVAICSTHTHSAPWVQGFAPNIFGGPIPPEEQAHVERYTRDLCDYLEKAAVQALANRLPSKLTRGMGKATFAANRRTKGGPVDHDLPALFVTSPDGNLRAVFISYACHCTTLGGDFNQICGDWAGYAADKIENNSPNSIALVALGCAGDANPNPRTSLAFAKDHGESVLKAMAEATDHQLPMNGKLTCRLKQFDLPLDALPTRAEWEARAKDTNYIGGHARMNLARLDRGEKLTAKVPYIVQTWTFGDNLAMVFLAGEVVVDYSLRLKREFDSSRLWINAYANDVPCYIPSERILKEGGYEGGGAMIFYDKPTRFAPGLENVIVDAVHELIPKKFSVHVP
jgi:hypothetical protein